MLIGVEWKGWLSLSVSLRVNEQSVQPFRPWTEGGKEEWERS